MKHPQYRTIFTIVLPLILSAALSYGGEEILSLPGNGRYSPQTATGEELIFLPGSGQKPNSSVTPIEIPGTPEIPQSPNTQVTSPEIVIDPLAPDPSPPMVTTIAPTVTTLAPTNFPVMPKDTSSAVFMVMKTWECQDYDIKTLIEHAVGVYGQEAEDKFEVKGMSELAPVNITIKEEDVTLDELLDVVTRKAGLDWGVDVTQKTVFIYPGKKP